MRSVYTKAYLLFIGQSKLKHKRALCLRSHSLNLLHIRSYHFTYFAFGLVFTFPIEISLRPCCNLIIKKKIYYTSLIRKIFNHFR